MITLSELVEDKLEGSWIYARRKKINAKSPESRSRRFTVKNYLGEGVGDRPDHQEEVGDVQDPQEKEQEMYKRIWRNSRRYTKESGEGAVDTQEHQRTGN